MAGARLVKYAPISIAVDSMGLNVTGFSYAGTMCICAISCREMLPDPGFFAQCMTDAFEELKAAAADLVVAEATPRLAAPAKPARKPRAQPAKAKRAARKPKKAAAA
jgi:hypothetical protein